ncbi:hypothetical protein CR513_18026, partial [Mucuna pruriens]
MNISSQKVSKEIVQNAIMKTKSFTEDNLIGMYVLLPLAWRAFPHDLCQEKRIFLIGYFSDTRRRLSYLLTAVTLSRQLDFLGTSRDSSAYALSVGRLTGRHVVFSGSVGHGRTFLYLYFLASACYSPYFPLPFALVLRFLHSLFKLLLLFNHSSSGAMDADIRGPSPGVAGFSQENRPSSRVASGADSSSSDGILSSPSSGEIFPFEIWYRDNTEDDVSEDPFSWVDDEVKETHSQYTQGSLRLGLMKKHLCPGPWRVRLRHCQLDEFVNNRTSSEEAPFFYAYESVFSKLGLKLPFTSFEQSVLRALNVAPSQLHPNSWAFVRAFELLCEDLGHAPSLGVFFWFFRVKKAPKVGWMSLSSRPN